mgnify:CR=1 FL=1
MTLLESPTRLRAGRVFAKSESEASLALMNQMSERGHPEQPPPLVSDGGTGCADAMIAVWGQVPPHVGQPRKPTRKKASPMWMHLRVRKARDEERRIVGLNYQVVFGDKDTVLAQLGGGTVYIERTHLTMRHSNARLTRKGLGFSKQLTAHKAMAAWEDLVYNLIKPLKTLQKPAAPESGRVWEPQTPAMAAGLSDHPWTFKELLTRIPIYVQQPP